MRILVLFFSVCLASLPALAQTVSGTATVLEVQGQADYRTGPQDTWQDIKVRQQLKPGQTLRTGSHGRLALLLSDRTQIRLNNNSILEIQAIEPAPRTAGQSKFRQLRGRAWVQSKTPPKELKWETPTAIAGIRGTDWEVEVAEDGRSLLSVFSGQVDFANDLGRVEVHANEQALVEPGKAPIKLVVKNLKDRIQWVTAYRMEPMRLIALDGRDLPTLRQALSEITGQDAESNIRRGRILADLGRWLEADAAFEDAMKAEPTNRNALIGLAYSALQQGDSRAAAALLKQSQSDAPDAAWRYADIAQKMMTGDLDAAQAALNAISAPEQPTPWLLTAELLTYQGQSDAALAELQKGLQRFPDDHRLLAAQARLLLLEDRVADAKAASNQAIDANLSSYEGWLTRADIARREGEASVAFGAYDLAIALKPDDDRAWFGRGAAHAEREFIAEARADLDQATLLNAKGIGYLGERATLETMAGDFAEAESAYRAALDANPADYVALTGLGLLQLKRGQTQEALDSFLKAGVMEPRYARAHVYTAVAYYQQGDVKQALEELKRAGDLDDKDPLPHFMAAMIDSDRLRPADAIDAARAALTRMPYLKSLNQLANDQQGSANLGQAFAFFGMEDWAKAYAQDSYSPFWAGSHLFLADRYSGLFTKNSELFQGLISDPTVFGAGNRFKSLVQAPSQNLGLSLRYTRSDNIDGFSPQAELSGYSVKPKPTAYYLNYEGVDWDRFDRPYDLNTLTAAFGIKPQHDLGIFVFADSSRQNSQPTGVSDGSDYDLDDRLKTRRLDLGLNYKIHPNNQVWLKAGYFKSNEDMNGSLGFSDILANTEVVVPELAFRHSFDTPGGHQISWGMDQGSRDTDGRLDDPDFFLREDSILRESSLDIYVSDVFKLSPELTLQGDLTYQRQRRRATLQPYLLFFDPPDPLLPDMEDLGHSQISPRLGLVYQPTHNARIRLAYQDWLRPVTFSALQPVATAGIPLDDRLVQRGGELERLRLQGEWEARPDTFYSGFLDLKRIDNNLFSIRPFAVTELESLGKLRPRDFGSLMRDDLYEFFDAPDYTGGKVNMAGFSVNHLLNRQWALSGRYVYTESRNSMDGSLDIPYLPRHAAALGATWIQDSGWYVAGRLTYRGDRFQDEANTLTLDADWTGDLDIFKESRDKRWLFRFSANSLFGDADAQYTAELNYRF